MQKAIIEEIIDQYHARVRIPTIHKLANAPGGTKTEELPIALICAPPGSSPAYLRNDCVFVDYINDVKSDPVIMGVLYRAQGPHSSSNGDLNSLNVSVNCHLPYETTIGEVSAIDLQYLKNVKGNLQGQIDRLNDLITQISSQEQ